MIHDADGVNDHVEFDGSNSADGTSKPMYHKIGWTVLIVTVLAMTAVIILGQISETKISQGGDSVQKNTTEIGLDIRAAHKAAIDMKIDETTATTSTSPVPANGEEPICGSLDDHMPLLLSMMRGDKVQVDNERLEPEAVVTNNSIGCLMPFTADQIRVVSTRNTTIDTKAPKYLVVPGLSLKLIRRAFVGKRIYFVGDSTARILFVALRKLLISMNDYGDSVESLYSAWLRGIFREIRASKKQWRQEGLPPYISNGTYLEIVDVNPLYFEPQRQNRKAALMNRTAVHNLQEDFLERLEKTLDKPDIIIFNAGMHLLHLTPMRTLNHNTYVSWIHYESLLEKLLQAGLDSGALTLIAKSTNKICSEKMPSDMKKFAKSYGKEASLKACRAFVAQQEKEEQEKDSNESFEVLSEFDRQQICELGVFDKTGSSYLNNRMKKWVREMQLENAKELSVHEESGTGSSDSTLRTGARPRLQYFDDHDIESCEYTEDHDGRHYPKLSLVRLHLLAILLDCMLPA